MEEYVKLNSNNGIGTIEFFHPQSNSLPNHILEKLANTITNAGKDDEIKVIILKSKGERAFCAGASFDELVAIDNKAKGKKFFSGFANVINAARKCPKFIIGRIQGKAVGGGVGMASATDYCFATRFSSVKLSELAIGIGPFVIAPVVQRKLGLAHFTNMCLNPKEWKTSAWAQDKGIYSEVYSHMDDLNFRLSQLINEYVNYSSETIFKIKSMFWDGFDSIEKEMEKRAEQSGELVLSDFTKKILKSLQSK